MTKFLIIRHAESDKTLSNIHGGSGKIITEQGKQDIKKLTNFMGKSFAESFKFAQIYSSTVQQVKLTAVLLSESINVPIKFNEKLRNIDMGILDGLSDEEATNRYPDVMRRLRMWREGRLDVSEIKIPNAEPLSQFVERIRKILETTITRKDELNIFIVTRSVGIAIINILLEKSMLEGKAYTRFRLDPCSATLVETTTLGLGKLVYINDTNFLERTISYPDD